MLFFSALLCVFCPSPFTKKPRPQPSFVGVVFRGHHERRAGVLGKAVRAMDESAEAEKAGIENEAADTKNHVQLFERSEETIYDRSELTEGKGDLGKHRQLHFKPDPSTRMEIPGHSFM